ncbi:MAG: glutaredoxin [Patescibacteria group bacterium]
MTFQKIKISIFLLFILLAPLGLFLSAENSLAEADKMIIYFFGRDDCKYCLAEKAFFENLKAERSDFEVVYYDVAAKENREKFYELAIAKSLPKITPLTLVSGVLIQGFDSSETTGARIIKILDSNAGKKSPSLEEFLASDSNEILKTGSGCEEDSLIPCEINGQKEFMFKLPFLGVVNLSDYSLFALAAILGFVDGFNPCAMWVLLVFLLILLQIGDRKKMWQIAGLFILAEAAMYYLILNVWYKTWDFVGLDYIVTPLIGILASGAGIYFLYKYFTVKTLVCDASDAKQKQKIEGKIMRLAHSPLTIITALGVIGVAFSVNIIEFACSIGIPQAFTKILEINNLGFISVQFYTFVYILLYMIDDLIVFGLALYGFNKLQTASYKYSRLSSLIGGILMLILGLLLIFYPELLVF